MGKTKIGPNLKFWFVITNYSKWRKLDKPGQTSFRWDKPDIGVIRCSRNMRGRIDQFTVIDGNEAGVTLF